MRRTITLILPFAALALACAAPSDDAFCDHVLNMQMTQEERSGEPSEADMKLCIEHLPQLRKRIGDDWDTFARCAMRAKTEREVKGCAPKLEALADEDRRKARDQQRSAVDAQREVIEAQREAHEAASEAAQ